MIHLGAREYDPTLGRFISVDPLIDIDDPQQMNAYAYANNRPVTASDPDGLMIYGSEMSLFISIMVAIPLVLLGVALLRNFRGFADFFSGEGRGDARKISKIVGWLFIVLPLYPVIWEFFAVVSN
nr:RHS repeat-associated core domain-containing protein [Streptomyces sp. TRM72054]